MRGEIRHLAGTRVAVIEDDRLLRDSIAFFLRVNGCLVESFGSAREAISAGGFRRFNGVVCDFLLPGENGLSVLRRVREESETTVTILIVAKRGNELPEEARRVGIDCTLVKPLRTEELEELLRQLSGRGRTEEPVGGATA
jgi:DNA-binding response OmpR family regulator